MSSEETPTVETEEFTYPELPEEIGDLSADENEKISFEDFPEVDFQETSVVDEKDTTTEILNAVEADVPMTEETDSYDFDALDPPSAEEVQAFVENKENVSLDDFVQEIVSEQEIVSPETENVIDSGNADISSDEPVTETVNNETIEQTPTFDENNPVSTEQMEQIEDIDQTEISDNSVTLTEAEKSSLLNDLEKTQETVTVQPVDSQQENVYSIEDLEQKSTAQKEVYSIEDLEQKDMAKDLPEGIEEIAPPLEEKPVEEIIRQEDTFPQETFSEEVDGDVMDEEDKKILAEKPENLAERISAYEEAPVAETVHVPTESFAGNAFVFSDASGFQNFTGTQQNNVVQLKTDNLSSWTLALNQISVSPVEAEAGQEIALSDQMYCQGAFVAFDGSMETFANLASVSMPQLTQDAVQNALMFFSGLSVMSLTGQQGQQIELGGANGILMNTQGDVLFFAGVTVLDLSEATEKVVQQVPEVKEEVVNKQTNENTNNQSAFTVPSYAFADVSLPVEDAYVFSASSQNAEIDGEKQSAHILIKAQEPLYGWTVSFENGTTSSLADVRTYQRINGVLPDNAGVISFNDKTLTFKNIKDIRIFDVPAYCGYGIMPA